MSSGSKKYNKDKYNQDRPKQDRPKQNTQDRQTKFIYLGQDDTVNIIIGQNKTTNVKLSDIKVQFGDIIVPISVRISSEDHIKVITNRLEEAKIKEKKMLVELENLKRQIALGEKSTSVDLKSVTCETHSEEITDDL